jgi:arylsulfatase A-like enzyme
MQKPNIIFILIDDMGWRDLGCYGSSFYETPHLDRLAKESVRFTDAYAACPVCSPTRASIMSGKYPATVGMTNYINGHTDRGKVIDAPYLKYLPLEEQSLASALQEGGYQTWHVGKWHLGDNTDYYPQHHGFDVNIGGCSWGAPRKGYFSPYGIETLEDGPEGEHLTDRLTDEAIKLIQGADRGKPFFLNLWHYSVHTPIQAPNRELAAKYERKAKEMGLDRAETTRVGEFYPTERKGNKRVIRRLVQSDPEYAAMVEHLDANIGRLLAALEQSGQADNTWVIFTSDNGGLSTAERYPTSNAPLNEGKGWVYEGGVREPLLIKGPGVTHPGSLCQVPVSSPDFYPTVLELAGLPLRPMQHVDGVSLMPLLSGQPLRGRDALFWHFPHYANQGGTPGCSIRMGDYKLIEFFEDNRLELYNLREDLGEQRNLADMEPARARDMYQRLVLWRESIDAKIPVPNPEYVPLAN